MRATSICSVALAAMALAESIRHTDACEQPTMWIETEGPVQAMRITLLARIAEPCAGTFTFTVSRLGASGRSRSVQKGALPSRPTERVVLGQATIGVAADDTWSANADLTLEAGTGTVYSISAESTR